MYADTRLTGSVTDRVRIPKLYEQHVYKALNNSTKMLYMDEFMRVTEIDPSIINPSSVFDTIGVVDDDDEKSGPVYISPAATKWMGFTGTVTDQLNSFQLYLDEHHYMKNEDYYLFTSTEYKKYYTTISNPEKFNLPNPSTDVDRYIVVVPGEIKRICLSLETDRGKQVRNTYRSFDKFTAAYITYQTIFQSRKNDEAMARDDAKIASLTAEIERMKVKQVKDNAATVEIKAAIIKSRAVYDKAKSTELGKKI